MVTRDQAIEGGTFHYGNCTRATGPRGGVKVHSEEWRANGRCQVWKTRPADFRLPIKHGMRGYGEITPTTAPMFHTEAECPLRQSGDIGRMTQTHSAFVQGRYLFSDRMKEAPDCYRYLCTCGAVSQDVFSKVQAEINMAAHVSEFALQPA